ncbi:MAG: hypothetical protein J2P15_12965 [Micromonosporaceae bacterium]|nr:hypothetical protein [Micromonosporaceae bacterium]
MVQLIPPAPGTAPPTVAALATARGMGRQTGAYPIRRVRLQLLIPALFLTALFGVLAVGIWSGQHNAGAAGFMAALSGAGLCLGVLPQNLTPRRGSRCVYVFEHGFIQGDRTGPVVDMRWDAIGSLLQRITRTYTNGIYTGTQYLYTVTRTDGVKVKLTGWYKGIAELGQTVAREVTRVQLPVAFAAVQRGEALAFGDLTVNMAGIACAGKGAVPWSEIQAVQINRGYVSLRRAGRWLPWSGQPASKIPNLFVFLTLADQLRAAASGPATRR